ncbi:MAG: putative DNA binding domain-containing protein [Kiritimatiellae bacterium]|nr:putative DNA binding domain-containing protein [Kiritimatiellia bacterium]
MALRNYIGEATAYDKKIRLERKDPTSWLKSVSAFANTEGGKLLFGVADDGALVGLADAEGDAETISEAVKSQMDPVPEIVLSLHDEDGKRFVVVDVKAGAETPYYTFIKGHRDAYVRIGNESVKASTIELKRLVLKGTHLTWDSLPSRWRLADFSFEVLRAKYFEKRQKSFEDTDFASFDLVGEDGLLTNAGALLADGSPIRHSRVFCTRWKGLTKAHGLMEALADREFSGGLLSLFRNTMEFIEANTKMMWRKTPDGRIEYPEYPERAYEEGLVNALIHRDYLELGSEVHVDIFDDRLEIYSPGGMPSGEKVQELDVRQVSSKRRNPVIADVFQRLELMERRGSGFKKILDAYAFESEKRGETVVPQLKSTRTDFFLILPNLNYGETINGIESSSEDTESGTVIKDTIDAVTEPTTKTVTKTTTKTITKPLSKEAREILKILAGNHSISAEQLGKVLGLSVSGVRYHIRALTKESLIRRVGSSKTGYWEVLE